MALTKIHGKRQIQDRTIEADQIKEGILTNQEISASANISISKLDTSTSSFDSTGALKNDVVASNNIINSAVTEDKIASNAVSETKLANSAVTESKIANSAVTGDKVASGAVSETKLADGSVTVNKIGTAAVTNDKIADGTIADSKLNKSYLYADGTRALTGNLDAGGYRITNVGAAINANDVVTKAQLDNLASGITWIEPVIAIVDTLPVSGMVLGDRYLLNSGDNINKIAEWNGSQWDYFTPSDNNAVFEKQNDSGWTYDTESTNAFKWIQFTGAGQINAGDGLTKTGNTLNIGKGDGIEVSADSISVALSSVSGLALAGSSPNKTLELSDSVAGTALSISNKVLSVNYDDTTIGISSNSLYLKDNSISTNKLQNSSVTNIKISDGAITTSKIGDSQVTSAKLSVAAINSSTGKIYGLTSSYFESLDGSALTNVDAVTLQGLASSSFVRTNASSTITTSNTLTVEGTLNVTGVFQLNSGTLTATAAELNAVGTFHNNFVPSDPIDGVNTTFHLGHTAKAGSVKVYLNGLRQIAGSSNDYVLGTDADVTTVIFNVAPPASSTLLIDYRS